MRVLVRREDFSTVRYLLKVGETALEFAGRNTQLSLPYTKIKDFYITLDKKKRICFTMICGIRMYEGEILDAEDIEPFTAALKEKLGGIINIEVRKN